MNPSQSRAMARVIARQIATKCVDAFTARRNHRRSYAWLDKQLDKIVAEGADDIDALCEQCRGGRS